MKNILFYTDTPISGGAEKHMLELAAGLDKDKYHVALACSSYKQLDEWVEKFTSKGLRVYRVKVIHKHDPRHILELKKIIREFKPDLIHLHLWNPGSCRYAFMAMPRGQKVVATEHDPFALNGIKKNLKKKTLRQLSRIIAVSQANSALIKTLYPQMEKQIEVIHNGINLDEFAHHLRRFTTQERNRIRHHLFRCTKNETVILSVAALHPRKGLKYLITAFKKAIEQLPELRLVIAGQGSEKNNLEKLIKNLDLTDKVLLIGQQADYSDIPPLMKSADLFVLPSIKEAFGLVILEAMAAQLPIIATSVGGIPEIIQNGKNGILVEPQNSDQLAEAIMATVKNQANREKMAFLGSHTVKNFSLEEMVKKTEKLYDSILDTPKS